ncbi:unnamed protein product [Withania somnifera]
MASQFQSAKKWKYDAFLNFRRKDFNRSFVTKCYERLEDIGINAFKPDERGDLGIKSFKHNIKSERGAPISTEISDIIEESRIAITVFSLNYGSSARCLDELTKIMECVDNNGMVSVSVFYCTSASSVSHIIDELLAKYEADDLKGSDLEKVQRWKDALSKAFNNAGFTHWEDECIEEIIDKTSQVRNIANCLFRIRSRVEEVKSLLKVESGGVCFIGVWGMTGVGKTTVARALFNVISCQFEGSYFLENVRRVFEKHGPEDIQYLQQYFENWVAGRELIIQMLRFKKVLIVLDDMDDSLHLELFYGKHDWFGDGSRVVTTTRNFELLSKYDVSYRVPELTNHEALELFSWHAFQQGAPIKDFEELSCCVVGYSKGVPLALEVLGSFLYKQIQNKHIKALYKLQDFRDGKINMFLHVAFFFRGKKKRDVIKLLDRLGFKSVDGVGMHDSIAQMGQQMAHDAEQGKPWNCSRLWHGKDINTVFSANQITRPHTFSVAPQNEANQKWKYDAFLSFRGDDTRNNFVAHLFKRLQDIGVNVFKDDVKLERGKFISTELLKAIEESRTAIIIFSEDYASSTWCLEELTMIMKCVDKKEQKACRRSEIYEITNLATKHEADFRCGLQKVLTNKTNLKDHLEKVQRWKDALYRAAGIAGLNVRKTANGNEAESIDKIINENFQNMHHTVSATEKYLVGIESRDVCFVGIWGIGGVGKTTVARKYFDKVSHQFQRSCFLANVREESKKHGLMYLQKTLLSRLLKEKSMNIASFYEGADMIKRRLCHWKVLIVFDDVDDEHQLEYLAGNHDWFGDGSAVITTTRNQDLLRCYDQLYSVPELAKDEAFEVFSWHAFQKRTSDKEFLKLSKSVVDYAKGLPLALKVLGSFLYKRGITEWRSALDRLKDTGYEKIKNIFLDIASFFRGRKRDDVITILNDVLIQKSLLYISEGMVEMHDLIEQMGQQVAHNVDQDKPWNHSRLWHEQDIKDVFSANQRTKSIKGIMVPIGSDRHICKWSKAFRNMPCLRLLIVKGEEARHHDPIGDLIKYLPAEFEPGNLVGLNMIFSSLIENFKEQKAFDKLTILNLSFSGSLLRTPNFCDTPNIQKIILKSCVSLVEIHPSIGNLKKLVFLNMENCKNLKSLPSSIQTESLESFNLSGCEKLEQFPEIRGNMELLSELLLAHTAIWELPSSIGKLSGISLLDLRSCENLVRLPASVSEMKKLKILTLKGCSRLAKFPENLGDLNQLEELYAGNTGISAATRFYWKLEELKRFDHSGCNLSDYQIAALVNLPSLLELNLCRNKLISLRNIIRRFSHLRYLNITHCQELKELPILPLSIEELYAEDFLAQQSIKELPRYPWLNLVSFTNYSFDQQSYTEESNSSSVLDEILHLFLLNIDNVVQPSLNSNYRVTCSIFKGFAMCCVTLMGAGISSPDSGLFAKYDYSIIKATLICNDHFDLKSCRTYGWCVCSVYVPLYASLQVPGTDVETGITKKHAWPAKKGIMHIKISFVSRITLFERNSLFSPNDYFKIPLHHVIFYYFNSQHHDHWLNKRLS